MKKFLTFFTISVLFAFYCDTEVTAQGFDLKFNRVLIVNDNQQIVPTGTVWKINSIYGEETNVCINVVCASTYWYAKV